MNTYKPYQPYQQSSLDWIFVPSVEQIESVSVPPMKKAWIMVQNEPIFALRSADSMGLITTDLYRFEKIDPKPKQEYITTDQLTEELRKLREEIHESIITGLQTASNSASKLADDKTIHASAKHGAESSTGAHRGIEE